MHRVIVAGIVVVSLSALGLAHVGATKYATYHIHHVSLTPTKVATAAKVSFFKPKTGFKYLMVTFHEVNGDDVQTEMQYGEIKAIAPNGSVLQQSFAPTDDPLMKVVLDPGGKGDGSIVWEVPASSHSAVLRWTFQPFQPDVKYPVYNWKVTF